MEHFTLAPLIPVENTFTAGGNVMPSNGTMTNLQTSQLHTHHKDQLIGIERGNNVMYENSQKYDTTIIERTSTSIVTNPTINLKSEYTAFTNCIQQSALLDQRSGSIDVNMDNVSLSRFCDLKYRSETETNNNNNNNCITITSQCTNDNNVIITNVRNLTSHNFKQLPPPLTQELNKTISATNCNSSSDLNAEVSATFNDCSLFFGNDLHHMNLVAPKAELESVQTHLPQYFNLNKMNNNETADIVYQQLPNDTSTSNNHFVVSNNDTLLNQQSSQQQQQQQQQQIENNNQTTLISNNSNENNNIKITASIPIYTMNANETTEANLVQKAYINTHQHHNINNNQTQQQNYPDLNNQHHKTNNKKLNTNTMLAKTTTVTSITTTTTSTSTTATPTTKIKITPTILENLDDKKTTNNNSNNNNVQHQQINCHNIDDDKELNIDTTITCIATSSTTIPTPTTSKSITTKSVVTLPSVQNAAILYTNKFLNTCNNKHKEKKSNNVNNTNNNYQEDSSNTDDSDSFCSSDEFIEVERRNFQGKKFTFLYNYFSH